MPIKDFIFPSIEREVRSELTDKGEEGAINIFKENLKALLMQAPIKGKTVMGYDQDLELDVRLLY